MTVRERLYYDFLDFRLDVEKQQLLKNGKPIQLTHKAFQILLLLVQNSGQTTKKEDIFTLLWADSFVEDANLTQYIYVLRKALGQTAEGNNFIETVPKKGYRFTVSVEQISVLEDDFEILQESDFSENSEGESELPKLKISTNGNGAAKNLIQGSLSKNGNNGNHYETDNELSKFAAETGSLKNNSLFSIRRLISFLLLAVIAIASAAGIYYWREKPPAVSSSSSAPNPKSIAVLPFRAIGKEVDKEKLGLGMADAVIMRLSKLEQIEVRPTSAVFRFTDQSSVDSAAAGRELGVEAVLEGTVQCDGERVRVSVQLIRATDGKSLWADSFQEKVFDVFALQDSISIKVAKALALNLTKQQEQLLFERTTGSAEAFQSYQLGIYFWNKRGKEDLLKSVGYFQKAVELDPNYAQAYAMLADSYNMLGFYRFEAVAEMKTKAREAAEKSVALDDSLGDAYVALAMVNVHAPPDYDKAQNLLERALALAPNNSSARLRYGWLLLVKQKLDEAVPHFRLAQEYDPLSPATNKALCNVLTLQRKFDEAIHYCEKSLEISPETPGVRASLANAYFVAGKYENAVAQIQKEIEVAGETIYLRGILAFYYAKMNRRAEAESFYNKVNQTIEKDASILSDLTLAAFALGRKEEALEHFQKLLKIPDPYPEFYFTLNYDPIWDDVRADERFARSFPVAKH